jgi:hypothetical protein
MKGLSVPDGTLILSSGTLNPFIRNAQTFHQERSNLSSGTLKPFIRNAEGLSVPDERFEHS